MLRKIQTLLKAIAQFFVEKPPADLTWQWVWDDASGEAIKQDSNPWLAYYAASPKRDGDRSNSSPTRIQNPSDWDSQKLIEFSQDKGRGFLPGLRNKLNNRQPSPKPLVNSDWDSQKLIEFSQDKGQGFLPGMNQKGTGSP